MCAGHSVSRQNINGAGDRRAGADRQADRQTGIESGKRTGRLRDIPGGQVETDRQAGGQAGRQTDRQAYSQARGQAD